MLVRFVQAAQTLGGDVELARRQVWVDKLFPADGDALGKSLQCSASTTSPAGSGPRWRWWRCTPPTRISGHWRGTVRTASGGRSVTHYERHFWVEQSLLYNSYVVSSFITFF